MLVTSLCLVVSASVLLKNGLRVLSLIGVSIYLVMSFSLNGDRLSVLALLSPEGNSNLLRRNPLLMSSTLRLVLLFLDESRVLLDMLYAFAALN